MDGGGYESPISDDAAGLRFTCPPARSIAAMETFKFMESMATDTVDFRACRGLVLRLGCAACGDLPGI